MLQFANNPIERARRAGVADERNPARHCGPEPTTELSRCHGTTVPEPSVPIRSGVGSSMFSEAEALTVTQMTVERLPQPRESARNRNRRRRPSDFEPKGASRRGAIPYPRALKGADRTPSCPYRAIDPSAGPALR